MFVETWGTAPIIDQYSPKGKTLSVITEEHFRKSIVARYQGCNSNLVHDSPV